MPQQPMQPQQPMMPQPPATITVKDHLYLEDMMSWNLLTIKKANFYMQQCQDPEVKQAIQAMMSSHQNHYKLLLNHIQKDLSQQPNVAQPMGQMSQQQPQMGGIE